MSDRIFYPIFWYDEKEDFSSICWWFMLHWTTASWKQSVVRCLTISKKDPLLFTWCYMSFRQCRWQLYALAINFWKKCYYIKYGVVFIVNQWTNSFSMKTQHGQHSFVRFLSELSRYDFIAFIGEGSMTVRQNSLKCMLSMLSFHGNWICALIDNENHTIFYALTTMRRLFSSFVARSSTEICQIERLYQVIGGKTPQSLLFCEIREA